MTRDMTSILREEGGGKKIPKCCGFYALWWTNCIAIFLNWARRQKNMYFRTTQNQLSRMYDDDDVHIKVVLASHAHAQQRHSVSTPMTNISRLYLPRRGNGKRQVRERHPLPSIELSPFVSFFRPEQRLENERVRHEDLWLKSWLNYGMK